MTALDQLSQINVATRRYIRSEPALIDGVYNRDPLTYILRGTLKKDFPGGNVIAENFLAKPLPGGPRAKGASVPLTQTQTEHQCQFDIKYSIVPVTMYLEDVNVMNKGPQKVLDLLKSRVSQAYMMLGATVGLAAYMNGIATGYTTNINGLAEQINDGATAAWDGNTYTLQGGLTRSLYGQSLKSKPIVVSGGLEYSTLEKAVASVTWGPGEFSPNRIVTTVRGLGYLKNTFQTQQRFKEGGIPEVGFEGLSFEGTTILSSRYCPGTFLTAAADETENGTGLHDDVAVEFMKWMKQDPTAVYPVGSLGNSGESLIILNARQPYLNYYVSNDALFGGGFRDFVPEAAGTQITGLVHLAHQITAFPKFHKWMYGFTS